MSFAKSCFLKRTLFCTRLEKNRPFSLEHCHLSCSLMVPEECWYLNKYVTRLHAAQSSVDSRTWSSNVSNVTWPLDSSFFWLITQSFFCPSHYKFWLICTMDVDTYMPKNGISPIYYSPLYRWRSGLCRKWHMPQWVHLNNHRTAKTYPSLYS